MDWLNPQYLSRVLSRSMERVTSELIGGGTSGCKVFRLCLYLSDGQEGRLNVIAKQTRREDVSEDFLRVDPDVADRELLFYTTLAPHFGDVVPRLLGTCGETSSEESVLLLEDVRTQFVVHPADHVWEEEEILCAMHTYAKLHTRGFGLDLAEFPWLRCEVGEELNADEVKRVFETFLHTESIRDYACRAEDSLYAALNLLTRVTEFLKNEPRTIVYRDFNPPNVGIPLDRDRAAVFLDWQFVGRGVSQIDILNLFSLHQNFDRLDRKRGLDYYFGLRHQIEGSPVDTRRFWVGADCVELLDTLEYLPVFGRMVEEWEQREEEVPVGWVRVFAEVMEELEEQTRRCLQKL